MKYRQLDTKEVKKLQTQLDLQRFWEDNNKLLKWILNNYGTSCKYIQLEVGQHFNDGDDQHDEVLGISFLDIKYKEIKSMGDEGADYDEDDLNDLMNDINCHSPAIDGDCVALDYYVPQLFIEDIKPEVVEQKRKTTFITGCSLAEQ